MILEASVEVTANESGAPDKRQAERFVLSRHRGKGFLWQGVYTLVQEVLSTEPATVTFDVEMELQPAVADDKKLNKPTTYSRDHSHPPDEKPESEPATAPTRAGASSGLRKRPTADRESTHTENLDTGVAAGAKTRTAKSAHRRLCLWVVLLFLLICALVYYVGSHQVETPET